MVVLAHCENGRAIDLLTRQLVAQGRLGPDSLPRSRPIAFEAECVHRFLALAEVAGATPYVVHVTGARPLAEIAAAAARHDRPWRGLPHHLLFERACHEGPDALRYVMTPPLRRPPTAPPRCAALRDGALDTYASDHCHLRLDRDKLPVAGDFTKVPTGLPGIGARLPLGFAPAVEGEAPLSPERLVEVACAAPARIFGLYPQKGVIAPGSDADIVVWDPSRPSRITLAGLGDGLDWSPYEGIDVPGSIRFVFARGDRVVDDGRFTGDEHRGAYLPRRDVCGLTASGSVRHPAAVDEDVRAAHVRALVRGEEDGQRGDVLGPAEARERRARARVGQPFGRVRLVDRRRQDLAGRDGVADDPARPKSTAIWRVRLTTPPLAAQ